MNVIKLHDKGAAVEDVQSRLALVGHLTDDQITGEFDEATAEALAAFCVNVGLAASREVNEKVWAALVDATYNMGDRTLYLRMPYFHGHDVLELQQALGALGFHRGVKDAIFGAYTELALRKFQMNMGLPNDGIAGAYTYAALRNLHHSWEGKGSSRALETLGFARAADVLESNAMCLFGTCEFSRSVASRMSNLAFATNPSSKIVSAESLSVAPYEGMMLVQVAVPGESGAAGDGDVPRVSYDSEETLPIRLAAAIEAARERAVPRMVVELPGTVWEDAGIDRSAQHFAITLLDAFCAAL
ncbi:MAG: peptidoglycan-binding protein [Eggerthellaceae bacterium]|nr:peptidoglycan-binding protein [Eggerthellaceae bacterium]